MFTVKHKPMQGCALKIHLSDCLLEFYLLKDRLPKAILTSDVMILHRIKVLIL